jgi:hypothetical protein
MSIYDKTTPPIGESNIYPAKKPATAEGIKRGLDNSNEPNEDNVFVTMKDLIESGVDAVVFIAPDGSKWKKTVDNSGAFVTTGL